MRHRPERLRLTWRPELQIPFESGWSIFQKVKSLNNLFDRELVPLIANGPLPLRTNRLRDCADSSWINFERFSDLLDMPVRELKNGFWDQLGIAVKRPARYTPRLCAKCWSTLNYHCVLFDLAWMSNCPWHRCPLNLLHIVAEDTGFPFYAPEQRSPYAFDKVLQLAPITDSDRYRMTGYVLEYIEWWQTVQNLVPDADILLSGLVSTDKKDNHDNRINAWQAGFARNRVPPRYGSWILENVPSTPCRYSKVLDAGRIATSEDNRATIKDDIGRAYRAIRRQIFRRYVRRHRNCLRALHKIGRDEGKSFAAGKVCGTCLAYVAWRMSIENVVVAEGLTTRRTNNFRLRLTEPHVDLPSDDPARLRFTYMQFFGIWAAVVDAAETDGLSLTMQNTISSPQILIARNDKRSAQSPLREFHCIYPSGEEMIVRAGRPCKSPWTMLGYERQCILRSQEWLHPLNPHSNSLFELHTEANHGLPPKPRQLWL